MTVEMIRELLDPIDECRVECDGFTRIAHHVLEREGIPHEVYMGVVTFEGHDVAPHFWIVLPTGEVVDYRLRMWTDPTAPHGVFVPPDGTKYIGRPIQMNTRPILINILSGGLVT